jgi:hypothetical protein
MEVSGKWKRVRVAFTHTWLYWLEYANELLVYHFFTILYQEPFIRWTYSPRPCIALPMLMYIFVTLLMTVPYAWNRWLGIAMPNSTSVLALTNTIPSNAPCA